MAGEKILYLYNPKYNIKKEMTYAEMSELTEYPIGTLMSNLSRGRNYLKKYGCYIATQETTKMQFKEWYSSIKYDDEVWRIIEGTDDKYRVSSYGRIQRWYKKPGWVFIMPFKKTRLGRKRSNRETLYVKIPVNGKSKEVQVHVLVAKHFLEGSGERVAHKNGILWDNEVSNLEYVSRAELGKRYGGDTARNMAIVRLDPETLEALDFYRSARSASKDIGYISHQCILDFINGKSKTGGGMLFLKEDLYFDLVDNGKLTHEYIKEHIIGRKQ